MTLQASSFYSPLNNSGYCDLPIMLINSCWIDLSAMEVNFVRTESIANLNTGKWAFFLI